MHEVLHLELRPALALLALGTLFAVHVHPIRHVNLHLLLPDAADAAPLAEQDNVLGIGDLAGKLLAEPLRVTDRVVGRVDDLGASAGSAPSLHAP